MLKTFVVMSCFLLLLALFAGCGAQNTTNLNKSNSTDASESSSNTPEEPSVSFAGKTVTVMVNFSAGGPTDLFARLVANNLQSRLPGNPTIIVENIPGAGGLVGQNTLYKKKPDGLTIGIFSPELFAPLVDSEGVAFETDKFTWIGGIAETSVMYVNPDIGVREPKDLLNPEKKIVVGGLSPNDSKDLFMRSSLDLIGASYDYVTGYPGNAENRQAFDSGEINFSSESLTGHFTAIEPRIAEGKAVAILQRGLVDANFNVQRDPRVGDIPTPIELVREAKGDQALSGDQYDAVVLLASMPTLARAIMAPPGLSDEMAKVWRETMNKLFSDPVFLEQAEQQIGFEPVFTKGDETQEISAGIRDYAESHPGALEYLKNLSAQR